MSKVGFGVDIGGTAIKVGLFNPEGKLLSKWEVATRRTEQGKDILVDVADFIKEKMVEHKLKAEDVIGIGVGIPGPIKENGEVLELPNLGFGHFNLEEELTALSGLNVKAGNDANVAALGEFWQGGGRGYHNMVLVTLGTGVGGGIIINGRILTGSNGAGGEIGHIFVNDQEASSCGCGKRGCLEQYASATGIVRLAKISLEKTQDATSIRQYEELSAKIIFDSAKAGDLVALEVVNTAMEYLGIALAHVAQIIDPEVFVIGGGVSKAGTMITDMIKKHYVAHVMDALKQKDFKLATLGNDAGIFGGAKLILA